MDLGALQDQADALAEQVANLTSQNKDLQDIAANQKDLQDIAANQEASDELPSWGLGVFAALGVLGLCVCLTLGFVLQRERVGKPIFKPLNPGIPVTMPGRASADDVKTDNV